MDVFILKFCIFDENFPTRRTFFRQFSKSMAVVLILGEIDQAHLGGGGNCFPCPLPRHHWLLVSTVAWSVRVCVRLQSALCKNGWRDRDAFWCEDLQGTYQQPVERGSWNWCKLSPWGKLGIARRHPRKTKCWLRHCSSPCCLEDRLAPSPANPCLLADDVINRWRHPSRPRGRRPASQVAYCLFVGGLAVIKLQRRRLSCICLHYVIAS